MDGFTMLFYSALVALVCLAGFTYQMSRKLEADADYWYEHATKCNAFNAETIAELERELEETRENARRDYCTHMDEVDALQRIIKAKDATLDRMALGRYREALNDTSRILR